MNPAISGQMNRPNIQLDMKMGELEIEKEMEEIELELRELKMQLERAMRQVDMITTLPEMEIDLTQSRIEMGLKPTNVLRRESAQKARQIAQEYVARKARQGDELACIEDDEGNPLIEQAVEEALRDVEVNVGSIPDTPPQMEFTPGEINLDMTPEEIEVRMEERIKSLYFEQVRLSFYLSTSPSLDVLIE